MSDTVSVTPSAQYRVNSLQEVDTSHTQIVKDRDHSIRVDEQAVYTYVGKAVVGSLTSDPVWQIQRITNSNTTILFSNGSSAFNQIWDDRTSLTYS